jgi:hypothetical protein
MRDMPKCPPDQPGKRHVQAYASVDERHVPEDVRHFLSMPVSAYTAQVGTISNKKESQLYFSFL